VSLSSQTVPTPPNAFLTRVWKLATRHVIFQQPGGGNPVWQPGSHNLIYARYSPKTEGGSTATLELWDVLANRKLNHYVENVFGQIAWSPDGRYLAYAAFGTPTTNAIVILNPINGQHIYTYTGPDQSGRAFFALAWSPDSKYIASEQENDLHRTPPASPGGVIISNKPANASLIEVWTVA
jgi:WD40 repeat protein